MAEATVRRDTVTCSAVIDACDKAKQWNVALDVLRAMAEERLERNTVTYSAAIGACAEGAQWAAALDVLASMLGSRVEANSISFYAAMHACEASGQWSRDLALLEHMLELGAQDLSLAEGLYEHAPQAGGPVDCFKHVVLTALFEEMTGDSSPLTYVDAHAAAGVYDLSAPECSGHRNFQEGVLRLAAAVRGSRDGSGDSEVADIIAAYVAALRTANDVLGGSWGEDPQYCLGSPGLALQRLRPQDRAVFFEVSSPVCARLVRNLALLDPQNRSRAEVLNEDSYRWLARAPAEPFPLSGRGLVLLDPPYDSVGSYTTWNVFALRQICSRWPESTVALWYPLIDAAQVAALHARVRELRLGDCLAVEFGAERPPEGPLGGSGMLILRPPRRLRARLARTLPALSALLAPDDGGAGAQTSLRWLARESKE
mmetsp:Transcript_16554/g.51928  ORF Transcript_16554/g.51928 Transcript_16554/m.51928 type:complete len:428 (+) Transcript_16554:311-1594(+)